MVPGNSPKTIKENTLGAISQKRLDRLDQNQKTLLERLNRRSQNASAVGEVKPALSQPRSQPRLPDLGLDDRFAKLRVIAKIWEEQREQERKKAEANNRPPALTPL